MAGGRQLPSPQVTSSKFFLLGRKTKDDGGSENQERAAIPGLFLALTLLPALRSQDRFCGQAGCAIARESEKQNKRSSKEATVEENLKIEELGTLLRSRRNASSSQHLEAFQPQPVANVFLSRAQALLPLDGAHAGEDIASRGKSVGSAERKSREARLGPAMEKEKMNSTLALSLPLFSLSTTSAFSFPFLSVFTT